MAWDPQAWESYLNDLPSSPWDVYTDYPREAPTVVSTTSGSRSRTLSSVPIAVSGEQDELSLLVAFCVALGVCDHGREVLWVLDASGSGEPLPLRADLHSGSLADLSERFSADRTRVAAMRKAAGLAEAIMILRRAAPPGRFAQQQAHPVCQAAFGREPAGDPPPDFVLGIASPLSLKFRDDLYDKAMAESIARHITALLTARPRWSSMKLSEAHQVMLTDAERFMVLEDWRSDSPLLDGIQFVYELFQQCARGESADKIAILPADPSATPWSYRQLDAASSELSLTLAGLGLNQAGGRVGLLVRRSPAMVVAIYGILRAGQAYVPLDPTWPDKRQCIVLEDVEASALVLGEACKAPEGCPSLPQVRLSSEGRAEAISSYVPTVVSLPLPRPKPEMSVYILYTSGTTGKPKGVDVSHLGLAGRTAWFQRTWPLSNAQTVIHKTPVTFAVSEWELFWPLCYGARLALTADGLHGDSQHVAEVIEQHSVTHGIWVPSLLDQLLEEARALPSLRCLICCGEALRSTTASAARSGLPAAELVNLYGPTEGCMTMVRYSAKPDPKNFLRFPIGRPMDNATILCFWGETPTLDLSPVLVKGELGFGGPLIATGYWNLPELTKEKFVDNPHGPGRVYRTGDIARWRADGCLEYLGRIDQQVKFNGVRIELGEIESTLAALPGVVSTCAFVAQPHLVVACALSSSTIGGSTTTRSEELMEALRHRLPKHTVPTRLEILPALPLTDRSKVDRRRLLEGFRERELKAQARAAALAAAALPESLSATETDIEVIMREVLGVSAQLPSGATFQELGFSSLLLGKLTSRIRRTCAVPGLPATAVYQFPNLRKLATKVDELRLPSDEESEADGDSTTGLSPAAEVWRGESPTSRLSWLWMLAGILSQAVISEFAFLPAYYVLFYIYFKCSLMTLFLAFAPVLLFDAFFTLVVLIAMKWLILGRRIPGDYPVFGWYYWRWWLVHGIEHYVDEHVTPFLAGTVLYSCFLRFLGAEVGSDVRINRAHLSDVDLISFGDNVLVQRGATLSPCRIWGGMLQLRAIKLGEGACVAHRAYVPGGTEVPAGMELGPMASSDKSGPHHMYPRLEPVAPTSMRLTLMQVCFGVPLMMVIEALSQIPVILCLLGIWNFLVQRFTQNKVDSLLLADTKNLTTSQIRPGPRQDRWGWGFIARKNAGYTLEGKKGVLYPFCAAIPWVMTFVHGFSNFLLVALAKRFIIGRFEEGSVQGDWDHFRRWLLERLVTSATFDSFMELWVNTEVLACLYRMLGAKIARRVNMDFFGAVEYDLINIETDVVFGSSVLLANTQHGISKPVTLLKGACILDHSCVMAGATVPEGALLGSFTVVPMGQELEAMTVYTGCEAGTCVRLFQRPLLPGERVEGQRVVVGARPAESSGDGQTGDGDGDPLDGVVLTRPVPVAPLALKQRELETQALQRHRSDFWFGLFNAWCVSFAFVFAPLPDLVYWITITIDFEVYDYFKDSDWGEVVAIILIAPIYICVTLAMLICLVLLKWVLIGKWTSGDRPYYSWFHFRWAALMVAFSSLDDILAEIAGTWLSVLFMRCMGAKVGKNVCFFGHGFEYDLLDIGDHVCIGPDCDVTAHTVENMVMKMEVVKFEEGCNCLGGSVVMPGGQMEPWSTLIEHSQVLKGDVVPHGCFFGGLPSKLLRGYPRPSQEISGRVAQGSGHVVAAAEEESASASLLGGPSSEASTSRRYNQTLSAAREMQSVIEDADFEEYQTDNESDQPGNFGLVRSMAFKARRWARQMLRSPSPRVHTTARDWTPMRRIPS